MRMAHKNEFFRSTLFLRNRDEYRAVRRNLYRFDIIYVVVDG